MNELGLECFVRAARIGMVVWVQACDGLAEVHSGDRPDPQARDDLVALLAVALREHYGEAASAVAERELGLGLRRVRWLPARTVLRAAECAETAQAMQMAQATMLRFEFSAELVGRRFRQLCWELSIDPKSLSMERRRAIDESVRALWGPTQLPAPEAWRDALKRLLTQGLH